MFFILDGIVVRIVTRHSFSPYGMRVTHEAFVAVGPVGGIIAALLSRLVCLCCAHLFYGSGGSTSGSSVGSASRLPLRMISVQTIKFSSGSPWQFLALPFLWGVIVGALGAASFAQAALMAGTRRGGTDYGSSPCFISSYCCNYSVCLATGSGQETRLATMLSPVASRGSSASAWSTSYLSATSLLRLGS
jgi:hypothetical protein